MSYVFCTIAIGEKYFNTAIEFAKKLNMVSKKHKVLIITNQKYKKIKNCEIITVPEYLTVFYPNGCFNYNLKYYPIKIASEYNYDFIIYFDADWEIHPNFDEKKIDIFLEFFKNSVYDFVFERPHTIGHSKRDLNNCFWRHKIEPYGLMETDKYDNGNVCNEQFLVFKNNEKLKIFVDSWDMRDKFSVSINLWPFAEGLEIGMSVIDANMISTFENLNLLSSCFKFKSVDGKEYERF